MTTEGKDRWRWPVRLAVLVGVLLLVAAPLLRFWVSPALAQSPRTPAGGSATYAESGTLATLFDLESATSAPRPVALKRTTTTTGDPAATTTAEADGLNVSVTNSVQSTVTVDGRELAQLSFRQAADRHSQALVDCCGAAVNGLAVDMAGSGSPLRLPWFTPPTSYPYFDPTLVRSVEMAYLGSDRIQDQPVDKFQQSTPATALGSVQVPGRLIGSEQPTVRLSRVHSVIRTLWVDPTTGIILRSAERVRETLRDSAGKDVVVLIAMTLGSTPEQEATQLAQAQREGRPVLWTHTFGPLLCLIGGGLLLVAGLVGVVVRARARRLEEDFPDELATFDDLRDSFE
jgi:hypothetical protein